MSLFSLLFAPAADDVLFFVMMLCALGLAAYLGQTASTLNASHEPGDVTLISGAILSLSGLLIGFMFSLSISGYAARGQAEIREALVISKVWQYTSLQPPGVQKKTKALLRGYLDDRIHFFIEDTGPGRRTWSRLSGEKLYQLWRRVVLEADLNPTPVMASVLGGYSELSASLQATQADWRRQIPDAACASFLSGYQYRGKTGRHVFILLLPGLTALALFMIAEIDLPGEGLIRVTPGELQQLAALLTSTAGGTDAPPYPAHQVY